MIHEGMETQLIHLSGECEEVKSMLLLGRGHARPTTEAQPTENVESEEKENTRFKENSMTTVKHVSPVPKSNNTSIEDLKVEVCELALH